MKLRDSFDRCKLVEHPEQRKIVVRFSSTTSSYKASKVYFNTTREIVHKRLYRLGFGNHFDECKSSDNYIRFLKPS